MAKAVQQPLHADPPVAFPLIAPPAADSLSETLRLPEHHVVKRAPDTALVEQRLLQRELEIARQIQESLLPKSFPELPGFDLAGFCRSARHVGGDFFDVISVSRPGALLVVADVMGKGVPAALFAATLRTLLRTMVQWTDGPGDLLARINRLMFQELSSVDMFVTAQVALLDADQRTLTVANAGHCPLLLGNGTEIEAICPDGMPIGIVSDAIYPETVACLAPSACALLYTDGVTETRNPNGDAFGQPRVEAWLANVSRGTIPAEELKQDMIAQLRKFESGSGAGDDQTFLLLRGTTDASSGSHAGTPFVRSAPVGATSPLAAGIRALTTAAEVAAQTASTENTPPDKPAS